LTSSIEIYVEPLPTDLGNRGKKGLRMVVGIASPKVKGGKDRSVIYRLAEVSFVHQAAPSVTLILDRRNLLT